MAPVAAPADLGAFLAALLTESRRGHLQQLLRDPETTGGFAALAGQARKVIVDKPFVAGVASGSVSPTFTAAVPAAGKGEVGLLLEVDVLLSVQRLANLTITVDNGEQVLVEQPAIGGRKKPWGLWQPFRFAPSIQVSNPSANFYVMGQIWAPVVYMQQRLYDAIRQELVEDFAALIRSHS